MIKLSQPEGSASNLTENSKATNIGRKKYIFHQTYGQIDLKKPTSNQMLNNKGLLSKMAISPGAGRVTAVQRS